MRTEPTVSVPRVSLAAVCPLPPRPRPHSRPRVTSRRACTLRVPTRK